MHIIKRYINFANFFLTHKNGVADSQKSGGKILNFIKKMTKRLLLALSLLFIIVIGMYGQVSKWSDEIRLKDGTLVIGEIIEHQPDKGYWILLPTGETKLYKNEEIESVRDKENTQESNNPVIINNNIVNNNNNNNNNNNQVGTWQEPQTDTVYVVPVFRRERKGYLAVIGGGGSSLNPAKKGFGMIGLDFGILIDDYFGGGLQINSTKQDPYGITSYTVGPMFSYELFYGFRLEGKAMIGLGNIKFAPLDADTTKSKPIVINRYFKEGVKFSYLINAQARFNFSRGWCFFFGYDLAGTGKFSKTELYVGLGIRMF